jgi:predicted component of type VI protein secretion system
MLTKVSFLEFFKHFRSAMHVSLLELANVQQPLRLKLLTRNLRGDETRRALRHRRYVQRLEPSSPASSATARIASTERFGEAAHAPLT